MVGKLELVERVEEVGASTAGDFYFVGFLEVCHGFFSLVLERGYVMVYFFLIVFFG